ncbi:PEP-CTERM sorting domain-containing protein [Roseateles violae]|uniref:PEP-CTERM sorting domain-containing protein n=1 Tax=Roseateles violae TaxID=3058042 RepID=A0ABT8DW50_9BURK|nr:PEP-CTERM sorting domain-containing protein [Pelomonas sp. PFR6]MDN3920519.1 PEP-CTERM sorting domain-containing protein [Pelomonas sp. PFR6]
MNPASLLGRCAAAIALAAASLCADAATPTTGTLFSLRQQNSANSGNFATGDIMVWGAQNVQPPLDQPGATVYGYSANCPSGAVCGSLASDPDWIKQRLFERDWSFYPHQYYASRPYDDKMTGPWSLILSTSPTFAPGTNSVIQTPSIGDVAAMPFVQSMTINGAGLTPSISWVSPNAPPASVSEMRVRIVDNSHPVTVVSRVATNPGSFQQGDLIYISEALPSNNYTVPTGLLQYGTHYSIAIELTHTRADGTPVSRSSSYFDFLPIDPNTLPGGVGNIQLPTLTPVPTTSGLLGGPLYGFNVAHVSANSVTFIDPIVATGFSYKTGAGDPNFRSVQIASEVGDGLYEVYGWDGASWILLQSGLAAGQAFDFTAHGYAGGVDRFEVRGIETSAELNPFEVTAFVTGLTFMSDGSFTGTMQAITVNVPEPGSAALLLCGLAALAGRIRRRA